MGGVLDADTHITEPLQMTDPSAQTHMVEVLRSRADISARPVDKILSDPNALYGVS